MDIQRAQQIWLDYQRQHDMSMDLGRTAGIDPVSGKVWIGESILAVCQQLDAEGVKARLYFVRIGQGHYYCKGACIAPIGS